MSAKQNGKNTVAKNGKRTPRHKHIPSIDDPKHCTGCGVELCGGRSRTCECGYRYSATPRWCSDCGYRSKDSERGIRECPKCSAEWAEDQIELNACPSCSKIRFCANTALGPAHRCRKHGGWNASGQFAPNFIGSNYHEAFRKAGLGELHAQVMQSDLMDATPAMVSLSTRALSLILQQCDAGKLFDEIGAGFREFVTALASKDETRKAECFKRMEDLLADAARDSARWQEYEKLEMSIDKLRDKTHKRAVESRLLVHIGYIDSMLSDFIGSTLMILQAFLQEQGLGDKFLSLRSKIGSEFRRVRGDDSTAMLSAPGSEAGQ